MGAELAAEAPSLVARPRKPGARRRAWLSRLRRLARNLLRRTSNTVLVLYALALGLILGLGSAELATGGGYVFGGTTIGAWTAWPRIGSLGADPYSRAVNARHGEIPLALGEGMLLTALVDDDGDGLNAACTYTVGGATPPARAWTLTIAGVGAEDPNAAPIRQGFTSTEVLRNADGPFEITISPEVQAGNWLPMPRKSGAIRLALRLYDTPVAASVGTLDRDTLPSISRLGCGQ